MILIEKIKAFEVQLTSLNGEDLGIFPTKEALAIARKLKVDLICTSLMSSPPPAKLIKSGAAKHEAQQHRKREQERQTKLKEIRLTPQIEDHDNETKKILKGSDSVHFVVKIQGKEGHRRQGGPSVTHQ